MRAYRFKMIIKNTKPPIWRRVFVPSGLTFSQLAHVINAIFELEEDEDFEFEFYQEKVHLREEKQGRSFCPKFDYSLQEASSTILEDYFEVKAWVTYRCGNEMSFRIEGEGIVEEYPYESPLVETFNGELPGKVLTREDADRTNEQLVERFFWKLTDENIYETFGDISRRMKQGDYGLQVAKNAATKAGNLRLGGSPDRPIKRKEFCLKEGLTCYTKEDLQEYARELHLRGYATLGYGALCEKIANELLLPSVMRRKMSILTDEEIAFFEEAAACGTGYTLKEGQQKAAYRLCDLDYIFLTEDEKTADVPADVVEVYHKINTETFHDQRRKLAWLEACLNIVPWLYIVVPLKVFGKIYRKRRGFLLEDEEIVRLMALLPEEEKACDLIGDKIVWKEYRKDDRYLRIEREQGETPFYIPRWQEVMDITEHGYPTREESCQKMTAFFQRYLAYDTASAEAVVRKIWQKKNRGNSLMDVIDSLAEKEDIFEEDDVCEAFMERMMELSNNTRMLHNRGHKINELALPEFAEIGSSGKDSAVFAKNAQGYLGNTVTAKSRKVYPNDPCPCGSGKKYKKCCGRN